MASIRKLELGRLLLKLQAKLKEAASANVDVEVGFSAAHAIHVHEMIPKTLGEHKPRPSGIGWFWGPPDHGPKFLEAPARELAPELGKMIRQGLKAKLTMAQSLMFAGLRLQRAAQERVPVEHGALRASAFTTLVPR